MNCILGPALSRRLGRSLGIDPVPLKTCNWNCVYCQLGRTRPVVNGREEYVPAESVVGNAVVSIITRQPMRQSELEQALARWGLAEVESTMLQLATDGRVRVVRRNGVDYWTVDEAHFPTDLRTLAE